MTPYLHQVDAAVRHGAILSPTRFAWLGRPSPPLPRATLRALTPATARAYLRHRIQQALYTGLYTRGDAMAPPSEPGQADVGTTSFIAALSAANTGKGALQDGWVVEAVDGSAVQVRRGGLALRVPRRMLPRGRTPAPGTTVRMRGERQLLSYSPGYYVAMGDVGLGAAGEPLVRVYWHLEPAGAAPVMHALTGALNRARLPFHFKVLNAPERFDRCDAGVLYFPQARGREVLARVARVHPRAAAHLRPRVPAFTLELAPGLGLAEDPRAGESFGLHRCGLLADALIEAHEAGVRGQAERRARCVAHFRAHGVDPDAPYLNPGSSNDYRLPPRAARPAGRPVRTPAPGVPAEAQSAAPPREVSLRIATELGARLAEAAVWHGDRCNWVGMIPDGSSRSYSSLEPDVYAGTAGVGLFAAELARATGDGGLHRLAIGAVRQSLHRVETHFPPYPWGLYAGVAGIAFAAARVGVLLGEAELAERARALVDRARVESDPGEFDLMFGLAGGVLALLAMEQTLGDPSLRPQAARLGEELLALGMPMHGGTAWRSMQATGERPLTGLSHGAAGAGLAFLELFRATGDARFRDGAEGAFAFERHWFDARQGNWADLRKERARGRGPVPVDTQWCHGSAGIALSRLRACELLKDEVYRREARAALEATRRAAADELAGTGNFSFCHGLAGAAEVIREGVACFGGDVDPEGVAARIAAEGAASHARGIPWRCGVSSSDSPSLLLGLAGIGRFYLRLFDPSLPSLLLVTPGAFAPSPAA
ncbi:MAG TPA: lanthionine synthetase LanC family protein [Longimicrobium sp.]|jgi:hypothetical protein|uniref:lanthionine synthetase LanC family protein n=1 Tax=Longimicrobium sp. TaxID=2029185 RepID=UPI002EDA16D8